MLIQEPGLKSLEPQAERGDQIGETQTVEEIEDEERSDEEAGWNAMSRLCGGEKWSHAQADGV